jgi:hypothetical protein
MALRKGVRCCLGDLPESMAVNKVVEEYAFPVLLLGRK